MTDDEVRSLPPGTELLDPYTGERPALDRHTDFDDGWWLTDGVMAPLAPRPRVPTWCGAGPDGVMAQSPALCY